MLKYSVKEENQVHALWSENFQVKYFNQSNHCIQINSILNMIFKRVWTL